MDTCDKCGYRAEFTWMNSDGRLLQFCGHHHRSYGLNLIAQGFKLLELEPAH